MSIKHAVLGLIAENPRHGYAVHGAFVERLGDFWELNYGQVYQILTTLEEEGLISGRAERVGKGPTRKVYSISPKGRTALRSWLARPAPKTRPFRDDFYIRLLFVGEDDRDFVRSMVDVQLLKSRQHLGELVDRRNAQTSDTLESAARGLFTEATILHAEADVRALELCSAELERLGLSAFSETAGTRRRKALGSR